MNCWSYVKKLKLRNHHNVKTKPYVYLVSFSFNDNLCFQYCVFLRRNSVLELKNVELIRVVVMKPRPCSRYFPDLLTVHMYSVCSCVDLCLQVETFAYDMESVHPWKIFLKTRSNSFVFHLLVLPFFVSCEFVARDQPTRWRSTLTSVTPSDQCLFLFSMQHFLVWISRSTNPPQMSLKRRESCKLVLRLDRLSGMSVRGDIP